MSSSKIANAREMMPVVRAVAIALFVAAMFTRLYGLGTWNFGGDERATIAEELVLFHGEEADSGSQTYRLPHAIPLGYWVVHVSHGLFGSNEFGVRMGSAVIGSFTVVVCFLLLARCLPLPIAIATSLLLLLWPHHIFRSQEVRHYSVAAFLAYLALATGALAVHRRSAVAVLMSGIAVVASILAHTLLIGLLAVIGVAMVIGMRVDGRWPTVKMGIAYAIPAFVAVIVVAWYVLPFLRDWNAGEQWGYSIVHSVKASIAMVGWGVILLAAMGAVLMLIHGGGTNWYWLTGAMAWLGASLILPKVLVYAPAYVFPLALPVFVLAGYAVGCVYEWIARESSPILGSAVLAALSLISWPGVLSHYQDGSRWPLRDAARFVAAHWQPGEDVVAYARGTVDYYLSDCCSATLPLSADALPDLKRIAGGGRPTWLVLRGNRGGLEGGAEQWLYDCAWLRARFSKRRLDEADYTAAVFFIGESVPAKCLQ